MKINSLTAEEIFRSLVTSEKGLTADEARRRFSEFGPNEIRKAEKKPLAVRFLKQFTHFLAILLWIAAFLAFLSDYLHPGEGMLSLAIAIVAVIFINAGFTFVQEYRAERALEEMKKLLPFRVKVMRDEKEIEIPARDVVPGDVILLSEGDKIPADARLVAVVDIRVNNAPLTGESEPVERIAKPFPGEIIASPNIVFAGTTVVSGSAKAIVFATGMRTEFGRIAHLTGAITPGLSPLQKEIVKITRVVAAIATATGLVFFAIGHLAGRTFWENFIFAVGIIIANVPEGLLPTVTLSLAMGSQRMAKRKALIKTLTSVEALGSVSVICTDKTGTLTQNRMAVRRIIDGRDLRQARTAGLRAAAEYREPFPSPLSIALLCNNTKEAGGELKGEPTEVALYRAAADSLGPIENTRLKEFPFDTERKRMSTVHLIKGKTYVLTKGAPEGVVEICSNCLVKGETLPLDKALGEEILLLTHSMMDEGLRVLAFAYREVNDNRSLTGKEEAERDLVFAGLIGLEDPPRPEVAVAIAKCGDAGIRIIMITGDGSRTALAIAKEIGLVKGEVTVIEGSDFHKMHDRELRDVLSRREVIFARMTPKNKLRVVNILQEEGERVAVTGDGVNDAPALKRADIGIAMGITGTDVAKEAADMILLDDNFATIVDAVEEGRAIFENIQKFITYIFAHLTPEAIPYILFALFRIPLPLTVMQILAIDLGTETIPALALGVEPPEADVMKKPPRPRDKGLVDKGILVRGYLFLGLIGTVGPLFAYFFILTGAGWRWGAEMAVDITVARQAATATFLGIVIMQIANVFACRKQNESLFKVGFLGNRLIIVGVIFEIILTVLIIYHPWGNEFFQTYHLPANIWLILIPFAIFLFFAEEGRKAIARRFS